jgi:hypothetical protein
MNQKLDGAQIAITFLPEKKVVANLVGQVMIKNAQYSTKKNKLKI